MLKSIQVLLLLICVLTGRAQFTDSTNYRAHLSSTGSVNTTKDNQAYLLNNSAQFGVRKKSLSLNFNTAWVYGKQNGELTNDDYSTTLDFNLYKTFPRFNYWGLVNYNTSESLNINNQLLAGAGIAYSIIDQPKALFNLSNGLLFDTSDLLLEDGTRDTYETTRNSFRLLFRFELFNSIVLSNTSFWQHSLTNGSDYILRSDASVDFKLNKWLALTTSYKYNRASRTNRENSLLSYGLSFERYF
ncbi:DUF481 domain-containing protein [Pedobacter faecalis]|uniref:DUF481 domain-containing protein n=1 Tax=Pedobacter faecalis TaxID=3041495 RepID=UPI0025511A04|nr:DUF481 domain-containing protein [Pedobacter sp. ELA7]